MVPRPAVVAGRLAPNPQLNGLGNPMPVAANKTIRARSASFCGGECTGEAF
jgi:hypothetical protein